MKHQKSWLHTGKSKPRIKRATKRVNFGNTCKIPECDKSAFCHGWCTTHWGRWQRHGDPLYLDPAYENPQGGSHFLKPHQVAYIEAHGPIDRCECPEKELLHVHHKDGNHYNNDPENLETLTPTDHHRLHRKWDGCQVEGCNSKSGKKGLVGGYCPAHHYQLRTFGKITNATLKHGGRKKKWVTCKVEGCDSEGYCRGYCIRHYSQVREHGEIKHVDKVVGGTKRWTSCCVKGCTGSMERASRGYCDRHYQQIRKFGEIKSVEPIDQSETNRRGWETRRLKSQSV